MPIIAAVITAILSGLMLWLMRGDGLQHIDAFLHSKRDQKRRAAAREAQRIAPIKSITDPRDAAVVLMILVAEQRGALTPEQQAVIEGEMRDILSLGDQITARFLYARFAAEQVQDFDRAAEGLGPLLCEKLTIAERAQLLTMLHKVSQVHRGPTLEQEKAIGRTDRVLREAA